MLEHHMLGSECLEPKYIMNMFKKSVIKFFEYMYILRDDSLWGYNGVWAWDHHGVEPARPIRIIVIVSNYSLDIDGFQPHC